MSSGATWRGVKKISVIIVASQACLCCGLNPAWGAESFPGTSVSAKSRNVASNTVNISVAYSCALLGILQGNIQSTWLQLLLLLHCLGDAGR